MALDKDDGTIEQNMAVANLTDSEILGTLIKRQTKDRLSDGHLWLSIVARPTLSTFTRLDRLTCAFVLLFITMLANIIYYDMQNEPKKGGLEVGPFSLSPQQIGIGIMMNLICFPPSFILIQLFRRSKSRRTRNQILKETIQKTNSKFKNNNQTKKTKNFLLPWWCKFLAYALSIVFTLISIFFIIIKAFTLGDEKVSKWLTSFLISILTSFLLTQPIQVAAITFLLALIFRKIDNFTNFDDDQDLQLESTQLNEFNEVNTNKKLPIDSDLDLESVKETFAKQKKAKQIIKQLIVYTIFLFLLFFVSFANKNANLFAYKNSLEKTFKVNLLDKNVNRINDIYAWLKYEFIPSIEPKSKYLNDQVSFKLGKCVLRQVRVKKDKCLTNLKKQNECFHDFNLINQDRNSYNLSWSKEVNSQLYDNFSSLFDSFQYKHSVDIGSFPYMAKYSTYFGGGYLYTIDSNKHNIEKFHNDISGLELLGWIDQQTRAVFIEFSLFNANLNVFAYCTIVFELLPTGFVLKSTQLKPVVLYESENSAKSLFITLNLLYMLAICILLIKQIRNIIKLKILYFKQFWNYINWLIVILSWAAFFIFLHRLYAKDRLFEKIKTKNAIIRLELLTQLNDVLDILFGFLTFFANLQFLKILKTNKTIKILMDTLSICAKQLLQFTFLFVLFWLAFIQLIYLLENDKQAEFSTIVKTFETTFGMILNRLPSQVYIENNQLLNSLIYFMFYVILVFILINMLITLLSESFGTARKNAIKQNHTSLLYFYLKQKIQLVKVSFLRKSDKTWSPRQVNCELKYVDDFSVLENSISKIDDYLDKKMNKKLNF